ncbi:MAG: DUF997 family protein [bacterium]|jgi:uncharacterized membrane protein YhdT
MKNKQEFVEDPRFQTCFREMIMCYIFFLAFFVLVMLATYTLGNYLVLGLPLWFLVGGVLLPVGFIVVAYILTEFVFEDTPLDPYIN